MKQHPDLSAYGIDSHWLRERAADHRLLVIYAHPDDESFGNAGTIARYSAAGAEVHYACATRGERGTVKPEMLAGYADIAELRTAELLAAAKAMAMDSVHFLGYCDSGMENTADNQNPDCLVQANPERVAGQLVALIRALRPQVIITFPPYGGYGHPDHIAIHHAALAAWEAAADAKRFPEQQAAGLAPWQPQKLYFSTFGVGMLKLALLGMRLLRKDPRKVGANNDIDLVKVAENVTPITAEVPVGAHLAARDKAWLAHRSQLGGMGLMMRLPIWLRRLLPNKEAFTRVQPPLGAGAARERDLFSGVR